MLEKNLAVSQAGLVEGAQAPALQHVTFAFVLLWLEHAKANGLIVPMNGYKVYVYGATSDGLSPQAWQAMKNFWTPLLSGRRRRACDIFAGMRGPALNHNPPHIYRDLYRVPERVS